MTLSDWFDRSGITAADFARRCGVHLVTVYKWKNGDITPRPAQMAAISAATAGAVTANDFVFAASGAAQAPLRGLAEAQAPLAAEARALGLDPDSIAANAIEDAVRAERARRWQAENREAIEAWNAWTDQNELPLAKYRTF